MSFYVCVWAFFKLSQHFFSSYFSSSSKPLSSLVLRLLGGKRSSEQLCTNKLADESGFKMLHNGGRHYLGSDGAIPDRQAHLLSATGTLTENKLGHILSLFLLNCLSRAGLQHWHLIQKDSLKRDTIARKGFFFCVCVWGFFVVFKKNIFLQHLAEGFVQNDYPEILHQNVFQDYFNQIKQVKIDLLN